MSDLEIHNDQHGTKIYPRVENSINEKIKILFNKKIRLCIDKTSNNQLTVICNINAYEKMSRVEGYYISYKDIYTPNSFSSFKNETENALSERQLYLKNTSPIDNIIFNNIEKFDTNKSEDIKISEDISNVLAALSNAKNLMYKAGKIEEIATFCRNILKNSSFVKIVISANEGKSNEDADIDIFVDKKYEKRLSPTEETDEILKNVLEKRIKENIRRREEEKENIRRREEEKENSRGREEEKRLKDENYTERAKEKQPNHLAKQNNLFEELKEKKRSLDEERKEKKRIKFEQEFIRTKEKEREYLQRCEEGKKKKKLDLGDILVIVLIIIMILLISQVLHEKHDKVNESIPVSTPVPTPDSLLPVQSYSSKTYTNIDLNEIAIRIAIPTP